VANALSPAEVTRVLINEDTHYATVIVKDDQLSLAIGKEGQNARLAARLTGWHIDIKSASLVLDLPEMATTLFDDEETVEAESGHCEYVGKNGVRCRNHARPGSRYCGVHEGGKAEDAEKNEDLLEPEDALLDASGAASGAASDDASDDASDAASDDAWAAEVEAIKEAIDRDAANPGETPINVQELFASEDDTADETLVETDALEQEV
jgi:hypothetical protein